MLGELNVSILDCSWLCLGAGIVKIILGGWWFVLLLFAPLPFLFTTVTWLGSVEVAGAVGVGAGLVGGVVLGTVAGRVVGVGVGWEAEYGRSAGT